MPKPKLNTKSRITIRFEDSIVERMNNIPNWRDKLVFIGLLELVLLALYWIPKTQKLGFYILCAFVGGIIVAELAAGTHVEQGSTSRNNSRA